MNGKQLRNSILQWAISGRLVPQCPTDEPAIELLKRINPKAAPLSPDDAPFTIPDSWCWVRLGSLCVFLSRGKSPKYSEERKYPVFAQKCNLKDGGISLEQARFLDPSTIDKWKDIYKLRNGDVLVNSTGTGTVCRTRMFDEKSLGDYPFVVPDSHVSVVRTYEEINSTFVLYYISSRNTQQYLEDNLAGSTNQKELYIGVLENLLIPLPPLAEQERIVRKVEELLPLVERYDKAQTELDHLNASLKGKLRASVLQEAIRGRLVPQDPNDEPAIALLRRINPKAAPLSPDDAPFPLPDNWCWCKVGDIVQINPKNDYPDDTMAAFIPMEKMGATYGSQYTYDEVKWGSIKKGYTHFANGDVAFAKITPCFQNRKSAVFKDLPNGIGAGTTEFKVLRPYGETLNRWYLLYFLKSSYFIAEAKFKGTANQQRVVKGYLENKMFPLPPLAEQERIVGKVEELFAVLDTLSLSAH